MTPAEMLTMVRQRYNAVGDSFFSDEFLYGGIYQAESEIATEARGIENTYQSTSTSGTRELAYPTNANAIRRIEYNGIKLIRRELIHDPKNSITEPQGRPGGYAIWDREIILFPTPDITGEIIKVFTFDQPSLLTATSTLSVPTQYHIFIVDYIMSLMYAKEQNDKMASYHLNLWNRSLMRIKREIMKSKSADSYSVVRDQTYLPSRQGIWYNR